MYMAYGIFIKVIGSNLFVIHGVNLYSNFENEYN